MLTRGIRRLDATLWTHYRPLTFAVGEEYVNTRVDKFIMDKYPRVEVVGDFDKGALLDDSAGIAKSESVPHVQGGQQVESIFVYHFWIALQTGRPFPICMRYSYSRLFRKGGEGI